MCLTAVGFVARCLWHCIKYEYAYVSTEGISNPQNVTQRERFTATS